jgi:hypothetical protein
MSDLSSNQYFSMEAISEHVRVESAEIDAVLQEYS